jgi:UDP-N-acetyl-D-mannosaminuronate dehydrogenase
VRLIRARDRAPVVEEEARDRGADDDVLVATDHKAFDWGLVLRNTSLVVDTRGVARRVAPGYRARVVMA